MQDHQETVDRLVEIHNQFKRILKVVNESETELKKVRSLASEGVLYTNTCLHKYHMWQSLDDSDTMPIPYNVEQKYTRLTESTSDLL